MKIFISYYQEDEAYVKRLLQHLYPLKEAKIDAWTDKKLMVGDDWKSEIEQVIETADAIIVCPSAGFFSSKFITDFELPAALERARVNKVPILPVIVTPCRFTRDELSRFQAANDPKRPLSTLSQSDMDEVFNNLAEQIEATARSPSPNDPTNPVEAKHSKRRHNFDHLQKLPLESPDEVLKLRDFGLISGKRLYAPDLFRGTIPSLIGKTFVDCLIEGPIIAYFRTGTFDECMFNFPESASDSVLYWLDNLDHPAGSVLFDRCNFHRCALVRIGFTGPKEELKDWQNYFRSGMKSP